MLAQLKDVVVKYLNEDPGERHLHAAVLVYTALAKAFPPQNLSVGPVGQIPRGSKPFQVP